MFIRCIKYVNVNSVSQQNGFMNLFSVGKLTLSAIISSPHQLVRRNFILTRDQLVNCVFVVEKQLHPDEGLTTFLGQHVPRLRPGQQIGDAALGQRQDVLTEQTLADRILR